MTHIRVQADEARAQALAEADAARMAQVSFFLTASHSHTSLGATTSLSEQLMPTFDPFCNDFLPYPFSWAQDTEFPVFFTET